MTGRKSFARSAGREKSSKNSAGAALFGLVPLIRNARTLIGASRPEKNVRIARHLLVKDLKNGKIKCSNRECGYVK